jgi:hypothetical protein
MSTPRRLGTFRTELLKPDSISSQQLSAGLYSLSTQSNIPYATLIGDGGTEKTFSWGEVVEVPDGGCSKIKNACFHEGNVVINSGADWGAKPARITVPVPLDYNAQTDIYRARFPADVRSARAAWLVVNIAADVAPIAAIVQGMVKRTFEHNTTANSPGGYTKTETIAAGTLLNYLPLGFGATGAENRAMALLDTAHPISIGPVANFGAFNENAYYVMEY